MPGCAFCCSSLCGSKPATAVADAAPAAAARPAAAVVSPTPTDKPAGDGETASESGRSVASSIGAWSKIIAVEKERVIPGTTLMSYQRERIKVRRQTTPEEILDIICHQFELTDMECTVIDRKGRIFLESRDLSVYNFDRLAHGATYQLLTQPVGAVDRLRRGGDEEDPERSPP